MRANSVKLGLLINNIIAEYHFRYSEQIETVERSSIRFLVCGSNHLGVKLAVTDSGKKLQVMDYLSTDHTSDNLIGITFSGNSVEVLQPCKGNKSILITGNKEVKAANHIDSDRVPLRYQPMLAYGLAILYIHGRRINSALYQLDTAGINELRDQLILALERCLKLNITPVFSAEGHSNLNIIFSSQYMECMKRPAISIVFPKFTHELLWTLKPADSDKYMFIHFKPDFDLIDGRFDKSTSHIQKMGIMQLVLNTSTITINGEQSFYFALSIMEEVAKRQHIDMNHEFSF